MSKRRRYHVSTWNLRRFGHRQILSLFLVVGNADSTRQRVRNGSYTIDCRIHGYRVLGEILWHFHFDLIYHRGQLSAYLRPMALKVCAIYGRSGDDAAGGGDCVGSWRAAQAAGYGRFSGKPREATQSPAETTFDTL